MAVTSKGPIWRVEFPLGDARVGQLSQVARDQGFTEGRVTLEIEMPYAEGQDVEGQWDRFRDMEATVGLR